VVFCHDTHCTVTEQVEVGVGVTLGVLVVAGAVFAYWYFIGRENNKDPDDEYVCIEGQLLDSAYTDSKL
jgi:hypothetical protein